LLCASFSGRVFEKWQKFKEGREIKEPGGSSSIDARESARPQREMIAGFIL